MEIAPETVLRDRYKVIQLLGKGGMGAVYLAYDNALEHEVAVKINTNPNHQTTSQFLKEAHLLAGLRHPNLPRVIDYFVEADNQFLVMDYIPGEDLKTLIDQQGALPVDKVLRWAEQLGSAVSYLHHQNPPVIHRDIKPSNLKLNKEGEIVLVDFGIAKSSEIGQATATGAMGYTPGYAPPEQYGTASTGPYSDQYALGATLYALLTARKPEDSIQRVLVHAELAPLRSLNPAVPQHIAAAIERAMSIRPQDRFFDVDEMIQALTDPSYEPTIRAAVAPPVQIQIPSPSQSSAYPVNANGEPIVNQDAFFATYPEGSYTHPEPLKPTNRMNKAVVMIGVAVIVAVIALVGIILSQAGVFGGLSALAPTQTALPLQTHTPQVTKAVVQPTESPSKVPNLAPSATKTKPELPTRAPLPTKTQVPQKPTATSAPVLKSVGGGGMLAFVSNRGDGKTLQIWGMDVWLNDQGVAVADNLRQITKSEGDKLQPAWSPDGRYLLYVAYGGKSVKGEDYGQDIFKLDMAALDQPAVNLTQRTGNDTDPAWSPDGKLIAYTNDSIAGSLKMIFLMDPDGGNRRRISVDQQEYGPTWAPDLRIAFDLYAFNNVIIYIRKPADDYKTSAFFDYQQMAKRTGQSADLAWSPDGTLLAYTHTDGTKLNVYVVLAETYGNKVSALTDTNKDSQPAWSPDSKWIAFTSTRDGNSEIYIMTAAGVLQTNLTLSEAADSMPAWQPAKP